MQTNKMDGNLLVLWYKDKVLKDTTDTTDYLDNSVNIKVDEVVDRNVLQHYVIEASQYCTQKAYNNHPVNKVSTYFYEYMLTLSNYEKLLNLYNVMERK